MIDYLIIGGGVAGLLTARELAMAGASVTVLERGEIGRESSWAGGGILSPLHPWREPDAVTALCRWSQAQYPRLAEQLQRDTGIDPQWWRCGALYLEESDSYVFSWLGEQGRVYSVVPPSSVAALQRGLRPATGDSLWLPEIAQIRNPRLLQALRADLVARGVDLRENSAVERFHFSAGTGRMDGVEVRGQVLRASGYVLTAGAWSAGLLPALSLRPVRGQMILFHGQFGLLDIMVMSEGRYLIPRRDGRILAGSTVEEAGFHKETTVEAQEALRAFALATLPALAEVPQERHWAGLRPGSPAGIPFIGRHPEYGNLYFNCGHFRNGVVLGAASARLVADLILGRPTIVPPEPYALEAPRQEPS